MITLYFINRIMAILDSMAAATLDPFVDYLNNSTASLSALRVPVILSDLLRLSTFFLPMGTIGLLLSVTIILILIEIVHSFIRWVVHLFGLI